MTKNSNGQRAEHTKLLVILITIFILLTLAFIWGHSMKSIPESQAESLSVLDRIRPFLELFIGKGNVTDHIVRKLAHFAEFASLGVELMALIAVRKRIKIQNIVNCMFAGLSAAVIDEAIQIVSNRGSQVQDVLLDFAGCCAGLIFAGLIVGLITVASRHKKRPKQYDCRSSPQKKHYKGIIRHRKGQIPSG